MFQFEVDDDSTVTNENEVNHKKQSTSIVDQFKVGDTIKVDNFDGVIKYIGPVGNYLGIWLGIEWDDPTRGKHNGTIDGIQYFKTSRGDSASFIRPQKVKIAKDIFSALHQKYGFDPNVMNKLKIINERIGVKTVSYRDLKTLDLGGRNIQELGYPGELAEMCPNVTFLNLADNSINDWIHFSKVCRHFKHLKEVDLSGNPLAPLAWKNDDLNQNITLEKLEHIVLGRLKYNWSQILTVSMLWPNIKNLQVPFNIVTHVSIPPNTLASLQSLDLESNQINDFNDICQLNDCLNLEYLNIASNRIPQIHFPSNGTNNSRKTNYFLKLKVLNLSGNLIKDWTSISELDKLQELNELRISHNPFLEKNSAGDNRELLIARIGNLKKLEGTEITKLERRDAEIDYLRKYSNLWQKHKSEPNFVSENRRYEILLRQYGEHEDPAIFKPVVTFQSGLLSLNFISEGKAVKPVNKKLMSNMTVQKVKMLLQILFKNQSPIISLRAVSSKNPNITFELENDWFDLNQYALENGDCIHVKWG